MLSESAKFKQLRQFGVCAAIALALLGCATTPGSRPAAAASKQPLATLVVATPDADHDLLAQLLSGEMALVRTDLKDAAAAYDKATQLSDDPAIAERAVALALAVGDADAAQRGLARWQQLGARPAPLAQARAQLALAQGHTDEARHQLELLTASGDKDAWRRFGRALLSSRDAAQAAGLLESLATPARLPPDPEAWLAMSELGDKLGRAAYAQQIADAAAARFKNAETYAWAAQLKFKSGDQTGAQGLFRKALASDPKNPRLRLVYASVLAQQHAYAEATKVLEGGAQDSDTYALRAALAARANDRPALDRLYKQLMAQPEQQRVDNAYLLGQLAELQGRKDEALDWYGQVDDDHEFEAAMRSALILQSQGKSADAHEQLEQLQTDYLDQPPLLRRAYEADAELYMDEQRYEQASAAFSRALQLQPDDPALLYARGLAYADGGKVDPAVADFRRLLQLHPGDIEASNALGYTLADADRDLPEAQQLIGAARAAKPNDPAIADSWGWLQYRLGHLDQAEQALRGAWLAHKDADVGVHLGEVLWKQGRQQDARHVFDEVRHADPDNASLRATLKRLSP